jgi:hypothetical protein
LSAFINILAIPLKSLASLLYALVMSLSLPFPLPPPPATTNASSLYDFNSLALLMPSSLAFSLSASKFYMVEYKIINHAINKFISFLVTQLGKQVCMPDPKWLSHPSLMLVNKKTPCIQKHFQRCYRKNFKKTSHYI